MLVPAVKRDALIHKCLLRFAMVNEQSVEYWEAFQNAGVDHNKVIYLWQSFHKWNKLLSQVNKDLQCNYITEAFQHINYKVS